MNVKGMRQGFHFSLMVALICASAAQVWCAPAATTTSLAITSGGNAVTTVSSGSMVTLTATVVAGTTPVTIGQVSFCDATAKYCTDIHIVGTAQLIQAGAGAGTAVFRFIPGIGSHSYKAVFAGTTTYAGSMSGPANFTVTGPYPTVTTATWSGTATGYTLTANTGGGGSTALTGKVSFIDATDGNSVLRTVDLTPDKGKLTFSNPSSPASWYGPYSMAVGDFNGDGIPDLALCSSGTLLLGNGDGTFVSPATFLPAGGFACAAADVNGDGKLDLVVVNSDIMNNTTYVTALLGNGDGTFTGAPSLTIASGSALFGTIAVADFNGDGIPDVAVATTGSTFVNGIENDIPINYLLLGKGDGTFVSSPLPDVVDSSMVVGDFNKDGIPDLVMSSGALLLGKGDGTFQATTVPIPAPGGFSLRVGDFNGDGNLDLVATTPRATGALNLLVLLGAGDGTFPQTVTMTDDPSTLGTEVAVGAVGDFNGDGILDLVLAGCSLYDCAYGPSEITILLGDGTGHFALSSQFTEGSGPDFMLSGDLNGDGLSDLLVNVTSRHAENPYTAVRIAEKQTATATASGITLSPDAPVPHLVFASYAGDNDYKPSKSGSMSVGAGTGFVTVNISSSTDPVSLGGSVTLTATVTGAFVTPPVPVPTGSVEFYDANTELGTAALSSTGVATISASGFTAGWHTIKVSYSGDSNYAPTSPTLRSAALYLKVIGTAASSVTIAPSATTITDQQPLTVSVTVNGVGGQPAPTGEASLAFTTSTGNLYLTAGTLENGTASVNVPAGTLWSGSNLLTVGYTGDNVYGISSATTTIIVSQVVITIPPPSPVAPGASITATATLQAGSKYSGTMKLACTLTGSPAGAQSPPGCALNPASIALTPTGTGKTVVTVTTTAATRGALQRPRLFGIGAGGVVLACILLCTPLRRRWPLVAMLFLVFGGGMIACGGGSNSNPGTPATTAGKYTFTLAGTDSADANTNAQTQFTITVQ
jgi:hypothetical protein